MATQNNTNTEIVPGGTSTFSFPAGTDTLVGRASADTLTNKTITGLILTAGTAVVAALTNPAGVILTSPVIGAEENDGVQIYNTIDLTSGRGVIPIEQYFHLVAAGATIGLTIANFFGATSNIPLVANAYYEIEIFLFYLKTTAGTVTWTLTNSSAPTGQNIMYSMSPITGISATDVNTYLERTYYNDATAARTIITGSLTTAVNHVAVMKIFLKNGAGTSLKIQATCSAGTITPGINSYWISKRRSPNNIGTFAA